MVLQRTKIKAWTMVSVNLLVVVAFLPILTSASEDEREQSFEIYENLPEDTPVGNIANGLPTVFGPPYSTIETIPKDLKFNKQTGEIRTAVILDRENVSQYKISVYNEKFKSIEATIKVLDKNDEAPKFNMKSNISLSESSNIGSSIHIGSAIDNDAGANGIQAGGYRIISGNDDGTFHLKGSQNGQTLFLSLEVKKSLDYETVKTYDLVIQVWDGGVPRKFTNAGLRIEIQDANDNTPKFEMSKYNASVKEDTAVGKSILQVTASDEDSGDYAKITYSLDYKNDPLQHFLIDSKTGVISVNKPLDYEDKKLFQLTAKAIDGGSQVDTAVVEIVIQNINEQPANINLQYLINGTKPGHIAENTKVGSLIGRISVSDPDKPTVYYTNINVTLQDADKYFELLTTDRVVFNIKLKGALDREVTPSITFTILAVDSGNPPLQASKVVTIHVVDVNDNVPIFNRSLYHATVQEQAQPGTSVIHVHATDQDAGNNAKLTYSIVPNPANNSNWFQIDSKLGLITVQGQNNIDCEENSNPWITVTAQDSGVPQKTGSTVVSISVLDVNDMQPQFEQTFYPVSIKENVKVGSCILKVSAQDQDCNGNIKLTYKLSNFTLATVDKFSLDPASGKLCIVNALDFEVEHTYEFPVFAVDNGGLSGNSMITVTVMDVNDNHPRFYPSNYSQNIDQNEAKQGRDIVTVQATDADRGSFGEVTYRIVGGDANGKFSINSKTGLVSLSQTLPLVEKVYIITVEATDGGGLKSEKKATVYVSVTGSDYPRPTFQKATYSFFISEDQPRRTKVGQIKATVNNADSPGVRYSIMSGDINGYFYIDQKSGWIHTNASLDREIKPFVLLNVMAETDTPPVFGKAQVNVTISDVNDFTPRFTSYQVQIHVFEDEDKSTTIYSALATDSDNEENGTVRYKFENNQENTFQIDSISGEIRLLKYLDYEKVKEYHLVIVAYDLGTPKSLSSNMTLIVSVTNRNDNPPIFSKSLYSVTVLETKDAGSTFLQVNATDLDLDQITFDLQPDPSYDSIFGIYPNTGFLYLKHNLDRELQSTYLLTVIAKDNGKPNQMSASAKINVLVSDANDNDPVFSEDLYFFQIPENVTLRSVGFVSATDQDIGVNAELNYEFLTSQKNFVLNPFTGEITTHRTLDREVKERYELVVRVKDKGDPSRSDTAQVIVMLTDENDNKPKFTNGETVVGTVKENKPKGTNVIRMNAVDPDADENGTISYSFFVKGVRLLSTGNFNIDPKSGQITTAEVLDFEAKNRYELVVRATDHGIPPLSSHIDILITVIDRDEREITPDIRTTIDITENIPVGSKIAQVSLSNTNKVSYYEFAGNVFELFVVNKTTGEIYCVKDVDFEVASSHKIGIHAVDQSAAYPKTSTIELTVNVQDVNDNRPEFDKDPYIISKPENLPKGHIVHIFTATDRDSGLNGTVKYKVLPQYPTQNYFKIDENTGALIVESDIDYEQVKEICFVVQAEDQSPVMEARLKSTVTVKFKVIDVNDNSPVFNTYARFHLPENKAVNFPITQVVAVDVDSNSGNGLVTYQIVQGNDGNKFLLDSTSGLLSVNQVLDRETKSLYNLNISASDHGIPPRVSFTTLSIQIDDINDKSPRFDKSTYTGHVTENNLSTPYVLSVSAVDEDEGVNKELVYILPKGSAEGVVNLNPQTGAITINRKLDREQRSVYEFTVYVVDKGQPTLYDKAKVIIHVDDENDNSPVFNSSIVELQIPENLAQTGVFTVLAGDADEGDNGKVTYRITGGNSKNDFTVNSVSGQLSCKALDREKKSTYNLTITASDKYGLNSQMYVVVRVKDINDNKPVFVYDTYTKRIREDEEIGTMVLLVSASDPDEGENGRITYSLGNDTDGMFRVDSVTGNITTTGQFDRETKSSYKFHLVAEDNGAYNRGRTTATIEVFLENVNDNSPVFQNVPYKKSVAQNTGADGFVLKVMANDLDSAKIHYSLGGTSQQKALQYFRIDNDSGDIYTARVLTTEALGFHYLHVIANDLGTPAKSTTGVIGIKVGSSNTYPNIEFTNQTYRPSILENSGKGAVVTTVTAKIVNSNSGTITYSFLEGNDQNVFSINGNGEIVVNNPILDYEKNRVLHLIVSATSGQLYGYAMLEVQILDVNDNAPRFAQNPYYASIKDDTNIGTTVTQVIATDADSGSNGVITYNILKQNQDESFEIDNQGYITTRLPIDFEIRDKFTIEIEAVDNGRSQSRTSTCQLLISVVDVNDQQPNFPSNPQPKNISEATAVGAMVAQVTANDVDKYPPLLYDFSTDGNQDNRFAIDKFTGKIYLAKKLDHEDWNHFTLGVQVTDQNNIAQTKLDIYVMDENDNTPVFTETSYEGSVKEKTGSGKPVLTVSGTDKDKGDRLTYSIETASAAGFTVDPVSGVISTDREVTYNPDHTTVQLAVMVRDDGSPFLSSAVLVFIQIVPINQQSPRFTHSSYAISIKEDKQKGVSITRVQATYKDTYQSIDYVIHSGNKNDAFYIGQESGALYTNGPLDREDTFEYTLQIIARDRVDPVLSSVVEVKITLEDVNDNYPVFEKSEYSISLRENYPAGVSFIEIKANDEDIGTNGNLSYSISSGDNDELFTIDSYSGIVKIRNGKNLDYEVSREHRLTINAADCVGCLLGTRTLSAIVDLVITVIDVNDHVPFFPVPSYFVIFNEGQENGSKVVHVKAEDGDKGKYGKLTYVISDDTFFRIDASTGQVFSKIKFDAENLPDSRTMYEVQIIAKDIDEQHDKVDVIIKIGDVDEAPPVFGETSYAFGVAGNAAVGTILGRVTAVDTDKGSAGKVFFFLNHPNDYLDVNVSTGDVYVKLGFNSDPPDRKKRDTDVSLARQKRALTTGSFSLVIEARSAVENSLKQTTIIEITVDQSCEDCRLGGKRIDEQSGGFQGATMIVVIVLAVLLVIAAIIVGIVVFRYRKNRKQPTTVAQVYEGDFSDTFDFSQPPRPPNYNDVVHSNYNRSNSNNVTASSDASEHSHHSVSSGRGSVEAEDDEEICMINSLSNDLNNSSGYRSKNMPDSGIQEDDTTSEPSVQNSKDYLARLGIDSTNIPVKSKNFSHSDRDSLPPYNEVSGGNMILNEDPLDLSNLDYDKLVQMDSHPPPSAHHHNVLHTSMNQQKDLGFHEPEPQHQGSLSSVINSEEEYSGSYNWDYLLDWGPQYQPLAHVFSEIARLKDDNIQPKKRPVQTVPQSNINSALKTQGTKMFPPPIITNAPPAGAQPARSRSSQSSGSSSSIKMPRTNHRGNKNVSHPSMTRSPITHDTSYTAPLTPSFTPSLSPLATSGPSMNPSGASSVNMGPMSQNMPMGHTNRGHLGRGVVLSPPQESEQELRI